MANAPVIQPISDAATGKVNPVWVTWFSGLVDAVSGSVVRLLMQRTGATITSGGYDPEGAETAIGGSIFLRTDTYKLYVKESATGNTGWALK